MTRLALVMIARDEADSIARCLESAKPYVDDMIVLDTGSQDETISVAEKTGARVYRFTWVDDFSAARNAALDYSDSDWNLVLDADEWIEGNAEQLGPSVLGRIPFIGLIPVENSFEAQGQEQIYVSWLPRILPRGVRYLGKIHEQPVSDLPRQSIPLKVGHDGYTQRKIHKKKGRNIALLTKALQENPSDVYYLYQSGATYEVYGDYSNAVHYYEKALAGMEKNHLFRHDLIIRMMYSLKKLGRHEDAIYLSEREMGNWEHSPDFFFALGDLLLDFASRNPSKANNELLPMIEASWLKCLEIGENPSLLNSVKGRGSYLAAYNLSILYAGIGQAEKAGHYRNLSIRMRAESEQR